MKQLYTVHTQRKAADATELMFNKTPARSFNRHGNTAQVQLSVNRLSVVILQI